MLIFILGAVGCPILFMTGVPCPACGISRAYLSVFRLDFAEAFRMHPLFPVILPVIALALFGKKPLFGTRRRETAFALISIAVALIVWIIRVFFVKNNGFDLDIEGGFIVQLIYNISQHAHT